MMSQRTFYKTVLRVEVLSEDPYDQVDLHTIAEDITHGECSGRVTVESVTELTGVQAAEELQNQASDPEFFCLTAAGDDLDIPDTLDDLDDLDDLDHE